MSNPLIDESRAAPWFLGGLVAINLGLMAMFVGPIFRIIGAVLMLAGIAGFFVAYHSGAAAARRAERARRAAESASAADENPADPQASN